MSTDLSFISAGDWLFWWAIASAISYLLGTVIRWHLRKRNLREIVLGLGQDENPT
jgi:hypothetical protein